MATRGLVGVIAGLSLVIGGCDAILGLGDMKDRGANAAVDSGMGDGAASTGTGTDAATEAGTDTATDAGNGDGAASSDAQPDTGGTTCSPCVLTTSAKLGACCLK